MSISPKLQIIIDQTVDEIRVDSDFLKLYAKNDKQTKTIKEDFEDSFENDFETTTKEDFENDYRIADKNTFGQNHITSNESKIENSEVEHTEIKNKLIGTIPIYQIESIVVVGSNHNLPARLVKLCMQNQIPVHFCSSYQKYYGSLEFVTDKRILNRRAQYASCLNRRTCLILAKKIVYQKIITQLQCTQKWHDWLAIQMLKSFLNRTLEDKNTQELMGIEGSSTGIYWIAFGKQVNGLNLDTLNPKSDSVGSDITNLNLNLEWHGRKNNPATDPVNLMLSLGYGMLSSQVQTALQIQGLDLYLEILHTTSFNRPGLVYNLMEFYRSLWVDVWVLEMLKKQIFTSADFELLDFGKYPIKINYQEKQRVYAFVVKEVPEHQLFDKLQKRAKLSNPKKLPKTGYSKPV